MYVENGVKSIKGLGQMQGCGGWGVATPPPNFGRGVECLSTPPPPPDFESIFLIAHICYYVQVIAVWGGGGGGEVGSH